MIIINNSSINEISIITSMIMIITIVIVTIIVIIVKIIEMTATKTLIILMNHNLISL